MMNGISLNLCFERVPILRIEGKLGGDSVVINMLSLRLIKYVRRARVFMSIALTKLFIPILRIESKR